MKSGTSVNDHVSSAVVEHVARILGRFTGPIALQDIQPLTGVSHRVVLRALRVLRKQRRVTVTGKAGARRYAWSA